MTFRCYRTLSCATPVAETVYRLQRFGAHLVADVSAADAVAAAASASAVGHLLLLLLKLLLRRFHGFVSLSDK